MSTTEAFLQQYYPEYDPKGGVTTSKTNSAGLTFSNRKSTPETHPWLYINPGQVDVNSKIYDSAPVQTGTGIRAGRQASPEEIAASTAGNNYFRNGGQGMDPRLMAGMTRDNFRSNQYRNEHGTYNQQHAFMDPARAARGLDPWTEARSSFQGKDQEGNPLNYQNQRSIWGNRGPGFQGGQRSPSGLYGGAVADALRNPNVGGGAGGGGQPPPATPPGTLPGNGTLPGGPPSGGPVGGSYVGLPPGHSDFGGPGGKQKPNTPQWWLDMMARKPGGGMT